MENFKYGANILVSEFPIRFGNCIQKVVTSQFWHFYFKFAVRTDFRPDLLSTTINGFGRFEFAARLNGRCQTWSSMERKIDSVYSFSSWLSIYKYD